MTDAGYDPFWMRVALGRPEGCSEEVTRSGVVMPCDKTAVGLRLDPEESQPYPVCAYHARADMVPLEAIVRFMAQRTWAQMDFAQRFADRYAPASVSAES